MNKLTVLTIFGLLIAVIPANTCEIDLTTLSKYEPVFLTSQFEFKRPVNEKLTFKSGETYYVVCNSDERKIYTSVCIPGQKNTEVCSKDNVLTARERKGLNKKCGPYNIGLLHEIGIYVPTFNRFAVLLTVCRNEITKSVFFSREQITGGSLNGTSSEANNTQTYSWDTFAYESIADSLKDSYSVSDNEILNGQQRRFAEIFGSEEKAKEYIKDDSNSNKMFLARGHLSANADQPMYTWRVGTFFYLNHVPQWQILNQGVWLAVENHVRKLAKTKTVSVTTGGHLQLLIEGYKIAMVKDDLVHVPKYVWKLIEDPLNSADDIAFVIKNFPYEDAKNFPTLCDDRMDYCQKHIGKDYSSFNKGSLTCCSVRALINAIGYSPRLGASIRSINGKNELPLWSIILVFIAILIIVINLVISIISSSN